MAGLDFLTMVEVLDWHLDPVFMQEYGDLVGSLVTRRLEAFEAEHGVDLIAYCAKVHDCHTLRWPSDFPLGSENLNGVPLTLDAVREVKDLWRDILRESMREARTLLGHSESDAHAVHERILFDRISRAFGHLYEVQSHGRPDWLSPQHLDVWFPNNDLAIEFHGLQHFAPVEHFGGDARFEEQRQRDLRKRRLCSEHGCQLLVVDQDYDQAALIGKVRCILENQAAAGVEPIVAMLGGQSTAMLAAQEAIASGANIEFDYRALDGSSSHRTVVPIAFATARRPCLRAFCQLRQAERMFAFEAMSNVAVIYDDPTAEPA